jgi:hypothetical protein
MKEEDAAEEEKNEKEIRNCYHLCIRACYLIDGMRSCKKDQ